MFSLNPLRLFDKARDWWRRLGGGSDVKPMPPPVGQEPEDLAQTAEANADITDAVKQERESDEELIQRKNSEFTEAQAGRMGIERQWFINLACLLSKGGAKWITSQHTFSNIEQLDKENEELINTVTSWYEDSLTDLTQFEPTMWVTPTSTVPVDKDAAELATKIALGLPLHLNLPKIQMERIMWQLSCGTGIERTFWNGQKGDKLANGVFKGALDDESVNPFEFYPIGNPGTADELRKSIQARYLSVEQVEEMYPAFKGLIRPESDTTIAAQYRQKMDILQGITQIQANQSGVLLKRGWDAPGGKYPNGLYCVWCGTVLLERRDLPDLELGDEFRNGGFTFYFCHKIPGRFWGMSKIEMILRKLSKVNKAIGDMFYDLHITGHPKLISPAGAIKEGDLTNDSKDLLDVNTDVPNSFEPHYLQTPGVPEYGMALINLLMNNMQDTLASHDASNSRVPPSVKSGKALQALQIGDSKKKGGMFVYEMANKAIKMTMCLKLLQKHAQGKLLWEYVKPNNSSELFSFESADLRNQTSVRVEEDNLIPSTRNGRQQFGLEIYKAGLLGNPGDDETRKRVLRLMQGGSLDEIWQASSIDAKEAQNENRLLKQGKIVTVEFYQSHIPHMQEHLIPVKTGELDQYPPEIKENFIAHIKDHDTMVQNMQARTQAINAPPPPAQPIRRIPNQRPRQITA
jgi:hypothetical protein